MKKRLLTVAFLLVALASKAQILTHIDQNAIVYIGEGSLMYNGGGIQTKGSGLLDIHGNVMVVGVGGADKFRTLDANGTPLATPGFNIVLRLNDPANYNTSTYGQLYINGLAQPDITGFVNKEYMATKNGDMHQMAVPFYNKQLSTLASDFGFAGFSNLRNNNAVGYWENERVVTHNLPNTATTLSVAAKDNRAVKYNNATRYYMIGTQNWTPEVLHTVKGVPYSDNAEIIETLTGAGYAEGNPISFGVGTGANINIYNERYSSYAKDAWGLSTQGYFNASVGSENGTYGRNRYQYSNPFFTNLDLINVGASLPNISGIRYEAVGVTQTALSGSQATSIKYVMFENGVPVGDTSGALIKPMGAFVIKLLDNNTPQTLNFNNLRRFAYTSSPTASTVTGKTSAESVSFSSKGNSNSSARLSDNLSSTLKQVRIIGLDIAGNEVGRTYYVVGQNLETGVTAKGVQVSAYSGLISTREETVNGNVDEDAIKKYWLYINQANEMDYAGKPITMIVDNSQIVNFKFEIEENAVPISDQQSILSSGKKFYIVQDGKTVDIKNNMVLPVASATSNLFYGTPNSGTLAANDMTAENSKTIVAFDEFDRNYKVVFAPHWKKAFIELYDLNGRQVHTAKNISANGNYTISTAGLTQGVYIVKSISENGETAVSKIIIK